MGCVLSACVTTPSEPGATKATGPLKLNPPKMRSDQDEHKIREKWISIRMGAAGMVFAQAKEGMDDVVAMSAEESSAVVSVKTLADVDAIISADGAKFIKKTQKQSLGEPCIRYERVTETAGGENDTVRKALNTRGRTMSGPFYVRTLGAVVMHPRKPGSYITLTCTRTSYHGEIGDYYEELFDDFVMAFVADNCLKAEPY
jgi:hypothetical protein